MNIENEPTIRATRMFLFASLRSTPRILQPRVENHRTKQQREVGE